MILQKHSHLPTALRVKIFHVQSLPLLSFYGRFSFDNYRVDLTVEDSAASLKVLNGYSDFLRNGAIGKEFDDLKFTTGHFKRGVE